MLLELFVSATVRFFNLFKKSVTLIHLFDDDRARSGKLAWPALFVKGAYSLVGEECYSFHSFLYF